jgi:hypothetical protein
MQQHSSNRSNPPPKCDVWELRNSKLEV